jgi:hypothetical protein
VDVVQVTGSLQLGGTEANEGFERIGITFLLDVPPRRLGAEVDEDDEGDSRNES